MVRTAQNKIFIFREGEKVQIEAYGEHIIRVRASKGEIENLNWTLLPPKEDRASVSEEGDNVVLENGGILQLLLKIPTGRELKKQLT